MDDVVVIGREAPRAPAAPDAIRPYVHDRIADVEDRLAELRLQLVLVEEACGAFDQRIQDADDLRRMVLANSDRFGAGAVGEVVAAAIELREQAGIAARRSADLQDRIGGLAQQQMVLRILGDQLDTVPGLDDAVIPEEVGRHQRAIRQIFGLVDAEYDSAERDMYAGPLQAMSDLCLEAETVGRPGGQPPTGEELAGLRRGSARAQAAIRRFAGNRRPGPLDDDGLVSAVRTFAAALAAETAIPVHVHVVGAERPLDAPSRSVLFRVVQEALTNAARHASAPSVEVVITYAAHRVVAVVRDEGHGFDVAATEARLGRSSGMGLITMRQYAHAADARFDVRSQVGAGSEVRLTVSG